MDYKRIYGIFIDSRVARVIPEGKSEKHHIKPKSLGGNNRRENIVRLTPREHLFAHVLLAKIYNTKELWFALFSMSSIAGKAAFGVENNFQKERAKKNWEKFIGNRKTRKKTESSGWPSGLDHPMWGKRHTEASKEKMRNSNPRLSGPNHPMFGKRHSPETIEKFKNRWKAGASPFISPRIIFLEREDGELFQGKRYDFCKKYGFSTSDGNLTGFLNGKAKTFRKWRIKDD